MLPISIPCPPLAGRILSPCGPLTIPRYHHLRQRRQSDALEPVLRFAQDIDLRHGQHLFGAELCRYTGSHPRYLLNILRRPLNFAWDMMAPFALMLVDR